MFTIDKKPNCTWSRTGFGRGKRSVETQLGVYVIEHIATGKFLVGQSKQVSADVDKQIQQLTAGTHPNKAMNVQVHLDYDLMLHEYPALSAQNAKDMVREIKRSAIPAYLLLNP